MTVDPWLDILSRLAPEPPVDLDRAIFPAAAGAGEPALLGAVHLPPPSQRLWDLPGEGWGRIGIRVLAPVADVAQLASRLAGAAAERQVAPIIMTTLAVSGFERFGFRVERLYGAGDERARCEAELAAFWDLALIIDASEIVGLG